MRRNQSRSELEKLVEHYEKKSQEQIDSEVHSISNRIYAILVATECISLEVMFGKDVTLKITLTESSSEVH